jgi:DnaJ-class molecular chaperone
MPEDYYIVLGVSRGADIDKIKKAYRRVAKKYHPDVARSRESAEKFREVRAAYETLADEERRRRYDEELAQRGSEIRISRVPEIIERRRSLFGDMERFFSRADEFFEGFLPGFFDIEKGRIRDKDLYFEAILSPREAVEGGLFPITVPVIEPCPRCGRTGFWEEFFCPVCSGYGRVQSEREFSLSIPPHVRHGTEIRLSMEDIGMRDTHLHVRVLIDPCLE